MKTNFRYLFEFFYLSKGNSILMLFASLLSAAIQMLTAITIIPVIKQLDSDFELEGNVAEFSISIYEEFSQVFFIENELVTAVSFMLAALMLFSIISFVIESYSARVAALIVRKLRMEVLDTLINASWPYFGKNGSSDAVNHIITECAKIASGYRKVILTHSNFIQAIVLLGFSFFISFEVTIVVFIASLLVMILFLPVLKKSKKLGEKNRVLIKDVTDSTLTSFDNIKSIKAMSIDHFSTVLINTTKALEKNTYFLSIVSAITNNFRLPLTAVIIVIFLAILSVHDSTSTVLFLPLLFLFERITKTIGSAQNSYQGFLKMLPFYVSFRSSMQLAKNYNEDVLPEQINKINNIVFDCVSFSHSDSLVFENVNISFDSPSFNLIIGESGSGKTSLIDLIIGLLSPNSGGVFVNEVNLNTINIQSYRSQIGFVPQEVFLLNTSLRDNVLIGRKNFADKDIMRALDLAGLSNLCSTLPHGLGSDLGENGRLISGGQRQRVLIARALLSNPSLLILDEPTSGLDSNSTKKFIDSIQRIKGKGVLIIVISHDKAMLNYADKVLSLKNNRIDKV